MKKIRSSLLVLMMGVLFSLPLFTQTAAGGGYTGPTITVSTVAEAKKMRDDTNVSLEGKITRHLGGDKYLFTDSTGTVRIEIDEDKWGGLNVGAEDVVIIYGEVDKKVGKVEIDVDRIVKK
ncbi:NirD/YgiW/YdeI family stress tolerance protein [Brucepastera parasyntrophica]|uniref:YgiW/YdeI family stress tolerance OB fold protein n=1 Tax=Brucepastera parasyntrophica TaxID=2880008 RepID=UPI00210B16F8|nr:NirD/YgiW/YdeI family stress tolerance protein [Brucepastera parasyntrophica]ULQ58896.1 NirD/YgiW/YdeI family stress tolerance protein [Brucepastera parasyntrophica]